MASPPNYCPLRFMDQNFGMCITPRDLILPWFSSGTGASGYYRPWKWGMMDLTKDSTTKEDKNKFEITLDVEQFRFEEITVKVTDKEIKIEGKHEERKDNRGFVSRQFSRRYTLPQDCLSENVTSSLSSDGILKVVAKKTVKPLDKGKLVPIQRCGACPRMKIPEESKSSTGTIKKHSESDIKAKEDEMHKKLTQIMLKEESSSQKSTQICTEETEKAMDKKESQVISIEKEPKGRKKSQQMPKDELVQQKMEISKEAESKESFKTTEKNEKSMDLEKNAEELHKKNSQIMLKEEHNKLLRPELLGETVTSSTEKILAETRKMTDELMKMTEKFGVSESTASTSCMEEKREQTTSKMAESSQVSEKIEQMAMSSSKSEKKNVKSESSEVSLSQEASSYLASSMASNMAIRSEMTTDLLNDIITAELLRDAAENK